MSWTLLEAKDLMLITSQRRFGFLMSAGKRRIDTPVYCEPAKTMVKRLRPTMNGPTTPKLGSPAGHKREHAAAVHSRLPRSHKAAPMATYSSTGRQRFVRALRRPA